MYNNVSNAYKTKILEPSRRFTARLTNMSNTSDVIDSGFESIRIHSASNPTNDTVTIGGAVATYIDVVCAQSSNIVTDTEYKLEIGLYLNDGSIEWVTMGYFTPQKPNKTDYGKLEFVAYDRFLTALNNQYKSEISYPATTLQVLNEIESMTGLTVANKADLPTLDVPNKEELQEVTVKPFENLTFKSAIATLATMYGKFAVINRRGQIEFKWYTDASYRVETDMSYDDFKVAEKPFTIQYLACIVDGDTVNQLKVGSGEMGVVAQASVMTSIALNNAFNGIGGFSFTPTTVSFKGDPRLETGDIVTAVRKDDTELQIPLMSIDFNFDGGLEMYVGSYGNTEVAERAKHTDTTYNNGVKRTAELIKSVNGLSAVVSETATKATTAIEKSTQVEIDVQGLNVRVEELQKELDGSVEVYYTKEPPTLNNYPAMDWNASPLLDVTEFDSNGEMPFVYTDEGYRPYLRHLVFDETNSVTYRFVSKDGVWQWEVLQNSDYAVILGKIAELEVTTDTISGRVTEISTDYATKREMSAAIEVSANQVRQEVTDSKYATKAELALEINPDTGIASLSAEADEIQFKSGQFSIDANNFKLTKDGNMTATSGTVGGWTLGENLSARNQFNIQGQIVNTEAIITPSEYEAIALKIGGQTNFKVDYAGNTYSNGNVKASTIEVNGGIVSNDEIYARNDSAGQLPCVVSSVPARLVIGSAGVAVWANGKWLGTLKYE